MFDIASFRGYDWEMLRAETHRIMDLARAHRIWVILGSTHSLSARVKPTNCCYLISPRGQLRNRYDKCQCTAGDLLVYTPGNRLVAFTLKGFPCALLICADQSNPALYQALQRKGVKVLLHAFYNARFNGPIPNDRYVVPKNQTKAREYGMWIFANNSSFEPKVSVTTLMPNRCSNSLTTVSSV